MKLNASHQTSLRKSRLKVDFCTAIPRLQCGLEPVRGCVKTQIAYKKCLLCLNNVNSFLQFRHEDSIFSKPFGLFTQSRSGLQLGDRTIIHLQAQHMPLLSQAQAAAEVIAELRCVNPFLWRFSVTNMTYPVKVGFRFGEGLFLGCFFGLGLESVATMG